MRPEKSGNSGFLGIIHFKSLLWAALISPAMTLESTVQWFNQQKTLIDDDKKRQQEAKAKYDIISS